MRMGWLFGRNNVRAPWIVALLVLLNALLLRALDPSGLNRLRDVAFDSFQRLKPRTYHPATPVRIVDIDEAALAEFGQWPWPRTIVARLVDKLTEKGAAAIAFDVVFAEPDRSSISRMVKDLVAYTDPETVQKLAAAIQDNDKVLADAIAHSRVVLGFGFDPHGGSQPPKRMFGTAFAGDDPSQFLPVQQGTVKPLAILEAAAKGNGSVNTDVEGSVIRRVPMLFRVAGQEGLFPALSIEALRVAQGASTYVIKSSGASSEMSFGAKTGIVAIRTGDIEARTDSRGRLALYDSGHREERFVSARAVLKDEVPPDKLDGQIIFIGTSAIGLKDLRSTPVDDSAPGVEVHAQLAEQMIEQKFLARPDFADGAEFLYLAAIGALFVFLLPRLSAGRMTIVAVIFIGIGLAVPWIAFSEYDLLFDPIYPPVTLAVIYVSGTALAFMRTERERSAIRGAFGLYLSPDQVERIARHPELLQLGGEMREITVMFADLTNFTAISDTMPPADLMELTNRYFKVIVEVIDHMGGYVDKFIGDSVMAMWGAPASASDAAERAVKSAFLIDLRVSELNSTAAVDSAKFGVKIGISSGPAIVGNVGTPRRLSYTALGPTVNLAARLEKVCTMFGCCIVVDSTTMAALKDRYLFCELDAVALKGKRDAVSVHEAIAPIDSATPEQNHYVARYSAALRCYRNGDPEQAAAIWTELDANNARRTGDSAPALMAQRARAGEAAAALLSGSP